jgi:polysaccharide biosynthesis transport protein
MSPTDRLGTCWNILRGIWRRRMAAVLLTFLGVGSALGGSLWMRNVPVYVSAATVAAELSPLDQMPQFREFVRHDSTGPVLLLLRSRAFGEALVPTLQRESLEELTKGTEIDQALWRAKNTVKRWIGRPPSDPDVADLAVDELQTSRMEITPTPLVPGVIVIKGKASRPEVAADLVSAHVAALLSKTRSADQIEARRTREFLEHQLQEVKESLGQAEGGLTAFRARKGRIRLGAQAESDLDSLAKLESALAEARASHDIVTAQIGSVREVLAKEKGKLTPPAAPGTLQKNGEENPPPEAVAKLDAYRTAQERLRRLEDRVATLRERYTEAHPLVLTAQQDLAVQQARVNQLVRELPKGTSTPRPQPSPAPTTVVINPAAGPTDAQQQLAALVMQEVLLKGKIESLRAQAERIRQATSLGNLGKEELEFGNLQRTMEVNQRLVTVFTDKLLAARIREQGAVGPVRVLSPPSLPTRPAPASTLKQLLAVFLGSAAIALGLGAAIETWRQPVETEADVLKMVDTRVLGSVATIQGRPAGRSSRNRQVPLYLPVTGKNREQSVHTEAYRSIRTAIEIERLREPFRSVVVTSAEPHEGKSTTTLNLGHLFAEYGRRTLVIEADLRRPSLAGALGLTARPNLADVLSGAVPFEEAARRVGSGLTVLPGQIVRRDVGALLASEQMARLLAQAREQFDLILLDSAPLLAVADSHVLLAQADRVLLVVRAAETAARNLVRAHAAVEKSGGRLLGIVLNQAYARDIPYYRAKYRKYYGVGEEKSAGPSRPSPAGVPTTKGGPPDGRVDSE